MPNASIKKKNTEDSPQNDMYPVFFFGGAIMQRPVLTGHFFYAVFIALINPTPDPQSR